MVVIFFPLVFLIPGQVAWFHGQVACQFCSEIFCDCSGASVVEVVAAVFGTGGPVKALWKLCIVIVVGQIVLVCQLFYRVRFALVPGVGGRNSKQNKLDAVFFAKFVDFLKLIQFFLAQHGIFPAGKLHVLAAERIRFDRVGIGHTLVGESVFPAGLQER